MRVPRSFLLYSLLITHYSLLPSFVPALFDHDPCQRYRLVDVSHDGVRGNDGQALPLQTRALVGVLRIEHEGIKEVLIQGGYACRRDLDPEAAQQAVGRSLD